MKKTLRVLGLLLCAGLFIWLGSVGIIGLKTEQYVRQQFVDKPLLPTGKKPDKTNNQAPKQSTLEPVVPTPIRHTLVSYDSHFTGATAITRLDFGESVLSRWVSELEIVHQIHYGPLFMDGSLSTGLSHWNSYVNLASTQEDQVHELKSLFADHEAGLLTTRVNWNRNIDYRLQLNPIRYQDAEGYGLTIKSTRLSGQIIPAQPLSWDARLEQVEWHNAAVSLMSDVLYANGTLTPTQTAMPRLNNMLVNAPEMTALPTGETQGLRFKPDLNLKINQHLPDMAGELTLLLDNMRGPPDSLENTFKQVYLSANYQGLSAQGIHALTVLQTRLSHLASQLKWNSELLEVPEGQKNSDLIEQQIQQLSEQRVFTLFNQALKPGATLDYELQLRGQNGDIYQKTALAYRGTRQPLTLNDLFFYKPEDWSRLINGQFQLQMDYTALPKEWLSLLQYSLAKKAIIKDKTQYKLALRIEDTQTTLNGQNISLAALPGQFFPQAPLKTKAFEIPHINGIPTDIIHQIDQQGLTPDIMQQLEESDDVEPAALELLRQLYQMSEQLP